MSFFETSAKNGLNVNQVFHHIATEIIKDLQSQGIESNNTRAVAGNINPQIYNRNANQADYRENQDMGTVKLGGNQ